MNLRFWKKKAAPAPGASEVVVVREASGLIFVKVSGLLSPKSVSDAQAKILELGRQGTTLRGLIDATEFRGWARGFDGGTSEVEKMFAVDEIVDRMAVVADSHWHENLGLFLGAWMRKAKIEFFTVQERDKARAWLQG
jgi:hypothetical protein